MARIELSVALARGPPAKAGFYHVDLAEPQTLEKVIDQADVVVSTVPDARLVAERMVLDHSGPLINVSAMAASSAAVLRREPGLPRGTVLMSAGIAPGLTNLLAADLLARHPEADEVELVFTISVKGSTGPAGPHPEWLTATKRHRTTVVRLPELFGLRRCLGIAVVDEPTADRSGPALASQSRTGSRELPGRERGAVPRADSSGRRRGWTQSCRSG